MTRKRIGRTLVAVSLALAGAEAARAVDYTLQVPVDVKQLTPETKISITCTLLMNGRPSKTQTQPVALVNGATSEAPKPTAQGAPAVPPIGAAKAAQVGSPSKPSDASGRTLAAPPMKFVFALSDDEAKAVFSYKCDVDGGADLVKNGKALSNSVMQVGGCMSTKCTENARKEQGLPPSDSGGQGGPGARTGGGN